MTKIIKHNDNSSFSEGEGRFDERNHGAYGSTFTREKGSTGQKSTGAIVSLVRY